MKTFVLSTILRASKQLQYSVAAIKLCDHERGLLVVRLLNTLMVGYLLSMILMLSFD